VRALAGEGICAGFCPAVYARGPARPAALLGFATRLAGSVRVAERRAARRASGRPGARGTQVASLLAGRPRSLFSAPACAGPFIPLVPGRAGWLIIKSE
jgi:hypothetical protein